MCVFSQEPLSIDARLDREPTANLTLTTSPFLCLVMFPREPCMGTLFRTIAPTSGSFQTPIYQFYGHIKDMIDWGESAGPRNLISNPDSAIKLLQTLELSFVNINNL